MRHALYRNVPSKHLDGRNKCGHDGNVKIWLAGAGSLLKEKDYAAIGVKKDAHNGLASRYVMAGLVPAVHDFMKVQA